MLVHDPPNLRTEEQEFKFTFAHPAQTLKKVFYCHPIAD